MWHANCNVYSRYSILYFVKEFAEIIIQTIVGHCLSFYPNNRPYLVLHKIEMRHKMTDI